jgi:hypothetical protein
MIWRDLVFDYFWERASPLGRLLIIAVIVGAFVLIGVAIFQIGKVVRVPTQSSRGPTTTVLTSSVRTR